MLRDRLRLSARTFATVAVVCGAAVCFAPKARGAEDEPLQLERLEDVPGDRSVSDEGNSLEIGSVSDRPAAKTPAGKPPPPPPPPPKAAAAPPPPPPADSIADAPPPRPEPPAAAPAPARAENSPEIYYDEFGEPKKKRRLEGYESPFFGGLDIQVSFPVFAGYTIEGNGTQIDRSSTAVRLGFEWIPFKNIGKLGIGGAAGFFYNKYPVGPTATVDIYGIPFEGFVLYRFDYLPHQLLVPYVRGGVVQNLVKQTTSSDAAESTDWTGATGFTYAAGLAINLRGLGKKDAVRLDYNYGINDTFLTFEYAVVKMLDEESGPNLSSFAFRGGLRFEY